MTSPNARKSNRQSRGLSISFDPPEAHWVDALVALLREGGCPNAKRSEVVRMALFEEEAMDRERNGQICPRLDRQVDVGVFREGCGSRIDHDQARAIALGLANVRHEVNAGRRTFRPPPGAPESPATNCRRCDCVPVPIRNGSGRGSRLHSAARPSPVRQQARRLRPRRVRTSIGAPCPAASRRGACVR